MEYRKIASETFRRFNKKFELKGQKRINLRTLDSAISLLKHFPDESEQEISLEYKDEIELCKLNTLVIALLSIISRDSEDEKPILNKSFPANGSQLCSFLANIANTSQSALILILKGFDTQARILLRTLDERILQAIVLFNSEQDYKTWHAGESESDAKAAHYQLFSKKGRLQKKIKALEKEMLGSEFDAEQIERWRQEQNESFSMAVHGSMASVMVGSWAFTLDDEEKIVFPNVFGHASSASRRSLSHLLFQLFYFNTFFLGLLRSVHDWAPDESNEMQREYLAMHGLAISATLKWHQDHDELKNEPNK